MVKKLNASLNTSFIWLLLIIGIASSLYPLIWMFFTSLKTAQEAMLDPVSLFSGNQPNWSNYGKAMSQLNFFRYFSNSISASSGVCILIVIIYSMFGFALAKIPFVGRSFVFLVYLSMLFVPSLTLTVPLFVNLSKIGLRDTYLGLILPMVNGAGPMAMFLFRNYFQSVPHELYESATAEGASRIRTYLSIYLPLSRPIIITVIVLNFLTSWNELLWPMIILNDSDNYTLPLGLLELNMSSFPQLNMTMTGGIITIIPILILFLTVQKYYVRGLTAGSVKG